MTRTLIRDGEILDTILFATRARTYTRMPGIVVTFYPGIAGQSAPAVDVQPTVNDVRLCVEAGVPTQPSGMTALIVGQQYSEPWPILLKIPVRYPSGNGRAIWWRLKKGDRVELEALDLDPSTFRATGQQSDPVFTRRNSGAHWTCVPGDTTDPGALPDPGDAICFGTPGGVVIAVNGSNVNLGNTNAGSAVAKGPVVDGIFNGLVAALGAVPPSTPVTAGSLLELLQRVWAGSGPPPATPPSTTGSTIVNTAG